ncbi:MAG: hypothetical protein AAF585_12750 [Verrucomicrobiota bacterium]
MIIVAIAFAGFHPAFGKDEAVDAIKSKIESINSGLGLAKKSL